MKECVSVNHEDAVKRDRFLTKASVATIGLGLLISAIGFSTRDGVWEKERKIREAYPQGPQELWKQLEERQHLPQEDRNSELIIFAGFAFVLTGFGVNINLAPKEKK